MRIAMSFAALLLALPALAADAPALDDPQIATVALTAHQIDSERGHLALKKSKSDDVKQFAQQMVTDHEAGAKEVLDLAKKLGVKPEESAVTKDLRKGSKDTQAKLAKLTGAAFDKAYVDAEVAYHEAVISALQTVLIPGAKNAEVKQALELAVPTLQGHLQHAKNIQSMLATGGSGK
jgi:putative membrane protein